MGPSPTNPSPATIDADETLSVKEKVGYGLGDTASNFYWKSFEYFLVYFYTDVFGLTAKSTGTMLLVTRVWDAVNDPLIGYLADRTRTSWGRFRPYLVWMAIPFAVTGIATFYTPDLGPTGKLVYAYFTYTLVMMVYTAINVPYSALLGVISPSSLERTSVSTYRFVAAFFGGIIVQYLMLDLVQYFGGGVETVIIDGVEKQRIVDEQAGFFWTMVVFATTAVLLFLITFATTKERVEPASTQLSTYRADLRFVLSSFKLHQILLGGLLILSLLATSFSLKPVLWVVAGYAILSAVSLVVRWSARSRMTGRNDPSSLELDFDDLLHNRPWVVLFCFGLMQLTGLFVRGGAILYYFKYYCDDADAASSFLVCGSVASIIGMLLTKRLTAMFGKMRLMIYLNVCVAATTAAFIFLQPDQTYWMFGLHIAGSFLFGPSPVLLWAMYADTTDYSEWRTHRRATGLVFSAATFSQKIGCAIGAAMTGFALDFYQYVPPVNGIDQVQSQSTLDGLCMMMSLIPASFFLIAACCLLFYNISEPVLEQVERELRERKESKDAT